MGHLVKDDLPVGTGDSSMLDYRSLLLLCIIRILSHTHICDFIYLFVYLCVLIHIIHVQVAVLFEACLPLL